MKDYFLGEGLLEPGDSAVAIICFDDKYLVQLRSQKEGIYYPGFWGLFGGGVDAGESTEQALYREVKEELDIEIDQVVFFTEFTFDFGFQKAGKRYRKFYTCNIDKKNLENIKLGEGDGFRLFSGSEILNQPKVVPYDAFALWLHYTQDNSK